MSPSPGKGIRSVVALLGLVFLTGLGCGRSRDRTTAEQRSIPAADAEIESWNFDQVPPGKLPAAWKVEATNPRGPLATWEVVPDPTAPSGDRVLALARFNPLEDNFRLYSVHDGRRKTLADAHIALPAGTWHTLKIVHHGEKFEGYLNGEKLLEGSENLFTKPGGVGLWTKADAVTSFDDFIVRRVSR